MNKQSCENNLVPSLNKLEAFSKEKDENSCETLKTTYQITKTSYILACRQQVRYTSRNVDCLLPKRAVPEDKVNEVRQPILLFDVAKDKKLFQAMFI